MSQTDLQNLLYAAMASGSQDAPDDTAEMAAALAAESNIAALDISTYTPAKIIAHCDFRVLTSSQGR